MAKRDGFYRRGRFWWARDPVTGKARTTHCTSLEAAKAWRAERELMAVSPTYARSKSATLGEWCSKLLELNEGKSTATKQHDASKIKAILGVIDADTPLVTVDAGAFDSYVIERRKQVNQDKGKAPGDYTIRRELNMLVRVLKLAKRGGCYSVDLDALMPTTLDGTYTPRERSLTEEELGAFLSNLPNARWRTLVAVCVSVGCRASEAMKLTRADVDLDNAVVYVGGTKTKKSNRGLPILSPYRALLEAALPNLPVGKISNVDRTFKLAAKRSGIDRCSPNDLRRTHSTLLGDRGVHDDTIARLLGHTTVTLAKRTYNRAQARELAPLVEDQLAKAPPIVISTDSLRIRDSENGKGET